MVINAVLALLFGWLALLTFIVLKLKNHYLRLSKRTGKHSIDIVLDSLLRELESTRISQERTEKKIAEFQLFGKHVFQKVGLVQFHALGKSDGEKSFVIALLNELNTGIVINFIYIPEGVRVYAKKVKEGKGVDAELSEEEIRAIKQAG